MPDDAPTHAPPVVWAACFQDPWLLDDTGARVPAFRFDPRSTDPALLQAAAGVRGLSLHPPPDPTSRKRSRAFAGLTFAGFFLTIALLLAALPIFSPRSPAPPWSRAAYVLLALTLGISGGRLYRRALSRLMTWNIAPAGVRAFLAAHLCPSCGRQLPASFPARCRCACGAQWNLPRASPEAPPPTTRPTQRPPLLATSTLDADGTPRRLADVATLARTDPAAEPLAHALDQARGWPRHPVRLMTLGFGAALILTIVAMALAPPDAPMRPREGSIFITGLACAAGAMAIHVRNVSRNRPRAVEHRTVRVLTARGLCPSCLHPLPPAGADGLRPCPGCPARWADLA